MNEAEREKKRKTKLSYVELHHDEAVTALKDATLALKNMGHYIEDLKKL